MNYRRGFWRLYVVFALAWIALFTAKSIHDWPAVSSPRFSSASDSEIKAFDPSELRPASDGAAREYWIRQTSIITVPPLTGYLILFIVVPWIVRGFFAKSD